MATSDANPIRAARRGSRSSSARRRRRGTRARRVAQGRQPSGNYSCPRRWRCRSRARPTATSRIRFEVAFPRAGRRDAAPTVAGDRSGVTEATLAGPGRAEGSVQKQSSMLGEAGSGRMAMVQSVHGEGGTTPLRRRIEWGTNTDGGHEGIHEADQLGEVVGQRLERRRARRDGGDHPERKRAAKLTRRRRASRARPISRPRSPRWPTTTGRSRRVSTSSSSDSAEPRAPDVLRDAGLRQGRQGDLLLPGEVEVQGALLDLGFQPDARLDEGRCGRSPTPSRA